MGLHSFLWESSCRGGVGVDQQVFGLLAVRITVRVWFVNYSGWLLRPVGAACCHVPAGGLAELSQACRSLSNLRELEVTTNRGFADFLLPQVWTTGPRGCMGMYGCVCVLYPGRGAGGEGGLEHLESS